MKKSKINEVYLLNKGFQVNTEKNTDVDNLLQKYFERDRMITRS